MDSGGASLEALAGIPRVIDMIRERSSDTFASLCFWVFVTALLVGAIWCITIFGVLPIVQFLFHIFGASSKYMDSLTPNERDFVSGISSLILQFGLFVSFIFTIRNLITSWSMMKEFDSICQRVSALVHDASDSVGELASLNKKMKEVQSTLDQKEEYLLNMENRLFGLLEKLGRDTNNVLASQQDIRPQISATATVVDGTPGLGKRE